MFDLDIKMNLKKKGFTRCTTFLIEVKVPHWKTAVEPLQ